MVEPQVSNDDCLPPEVGNSEARLLRVLTVLEYDFNFLCDGSVLIWGPIDIVDWYWVWQGAGLQLVLLDEGSIDEHACCTRVEEGGGGDGTQGGGGPEFYAHVKGMDRLG